MPSVVFLGEDGQMLVGEAAERRGLQCPERMVREFKRRIGDSVPLVIGGVSVTAEDLFAAMARWVVDRAGEREGEPPASVTLSHPVSWGAYKTGLVRGALAGVGLADVVLLSEPEAAALHYASQERVEPGRTIAVYDLGGGTFDAAVLRKNDSETFTVLGRPGGIERLGGADFDQAVFAHVAAGAGAAFTALDPSDPGVLAALARVRRECTEAKEALSADSEATIPVLLPEAHTSVRLVRSEFESMIEDPVRETVEVLTGVLKDAGVEAGDLDAILLIGGSSRIPLVAELLSEEFDRPLAIDADPKASISLGAAFAAAGLVEEDLDEDRAAAPVPAVHGAPARPAFAAGASPVLPAAAGRARSRTGLRIGAVAVSAALLTGLTATAAQSPRFFGALSAVAEADSAPGTPTPSAEEPAPGGGSAAAPAESWFSQLTTPSDPPDAADGVPPGIAAPDRAGAARPDAKARDRSSDDPDAQTDDRPAARDRNGGDPASSEPGDGTADAEGTPAPSAQTPDPTPGAAPASPDPTAPAPGPTTPAPDPTTPPADPTAPAPVPDPTTPAPEPTTPPADPVPAEPAPADPVPGPAGAVEPDPAAPPAAPEG